MYLLRSSGKAKIPQTVKKFPTLSGTRKFVTVFTTASSAFDQLKCLGRVQLKCDGTR
jgi:hypothetical protein